MAKSKKRKQSMLLHPKVLITGVIVTMGAFFMFFMVSASAANDCTFTTTGSTMTLNANCTTEESIVIPNGMTLNGNGNTITAVDPSGNHFKGAVVKNGGSVASVKNLTVTAQGLSNVCDAGNDRLRGIMFEGASGSITHNNVIGINQGASGCQEGNGIEVRNAPFNLSGTADLPVEIAHNTVEHYQKTGILTNGDVKVSVHHNKVGSADLPTSLAANSIQMGFGAFGDITQNQISGNQWCGPSDTVATAVLLFDTGTSKVSKNIIDGNSDIGIYGFANNVTMDNNKVSDSGADCNVNGYDIGIGDYDIYTTLGFNDNNVVNNKVSGFTTLYEDVSGGKNKAPGTGSQKGNPWN